ncbi:hypothetical protein [Kordiimonas aestuarii]|uniref:hypothetical protein n=1 Tax=Kordiimonas aestuarii TaxID=1005925 RepID=UPI0021CEAB2C|nr:hypothetical protein [Kordiimonas aestuarii]
MANTVKEFETVDAFSFMGLMAANGQVPGAVCGSKEKGFFFASAEEAAIELALDLTAKGDFFTLMTANGMMRAAPKRKPAQFKITRPRSLGGGFGGMGGGTFGGGALAH